MDEERRAYEQKKKAEREEKKRKAAEEQELIKQAEEAAAKVIEKEIKKMFQDMFKWQIENFRWNIDKDPKMWYNKNRGTPATVAPLLYGQR